jgi:thioredoxin reductase
MAISLARLANSAIHIADLRNACTVPAMTEHTPRTVERHCDVAIVGGSAAGLAAALQLARQQRAVIVVDDGSPRNAPAAHMHGYLGREGMAPKELTAIGRAEVRSYGGEVLVGRALAVQRTDAGRFRIELGGGHALVARRVLAATGLVDELPDIEGLADRWGIDVVHCPFCHGFEVRGQRIVQVVTHPMGLHPTPLLRHLTRRLTVVVHGDAGVDATALEALAGAGVEVVHGDARRVLTTDDGRICGIELADDRTLDADAVVVGPRFRARVDAFAPLGLRATPHPTGLGDTLEVDPVTGQTAVPGVYAAGNVTDPSLQVLAAAAHGSRVGAMIAFNLAGEELGAGDRASGTRADWEHRYGGKAPMWSGNPNGTLVREVGDLPPGRVLDVGAGEGGDAVWLAEHGWQVTATDIANHRRVTDAVHAEGGRIAMQILHAGRYAYGPECVAPSAIKSPISPFAPRALDEDGIEKQIADITTAAARAIEAGYDGVEVMGSEGYFLNQFLVRHTNHRTDRWGGDYANRMRLPVEVVRRVRAAIGDGVLIYRISLIDLIPDGSSWDEVVQLAKAIEGAGASVLNTGIRGRPLRI